MNIRYTFYAWSLVHNILINRSQYLQLIGDKLPIVACSRGHWVRNMVLYLPKPDSLWLMALSDIFFAVSAFFSSHICRRIGLFKSMYIQKWKVQRGPKLVVSWSSQWFLCTCNPCCIQDLFFNYWVGIWHFLATHFFHSRPHFAFITITVCLICSVKLSC